MTEREKIVAWLRSPEFNTGTNYGKCIALKIENGEHMLYRPKPTIPASEWMKRPSVG